ncbi:MAG: nucleotide exchange factor GrpE [Candidatus Izemoplasmataceae bacterium]
MDKKKQEAEEKAVNEEAETKEVKPGETNDSEATKPEEEGTFKDGKDPLEEKEDKIKTLEEEVRSLKEQLLRNQAELQNFKRRMTEEKIKERKFANVELVKALLPVIDNLEIALEKEKDNKAIKKSLKGFEMIRRDLMKALKNSGLKEIEALNQPFDPNYHQAVMKEKKEDVESDIVIEEFQKGYLFKDRLVRPAMVKVSE